MGEQRKDHREIKRKWNTPYRCLRRYRRGRRIEVLLYFQEEPNKEMERRIENELEASFEIGKDQYKILVKEDGLAAVGGAADPGTASGGYSLCLQRRRNPKIHRHPFGRVGEEQETLGSDLEKKLESILEKVEGVGRVQVLLMTGQEKDANSRALRGEGTKVTRVLIAAEGADNSVTVQNIQQAVMALFQIDAP